MGWMVKGLWRVAGHCFKVNLPADSTWSGLLSLLQSLKIKIFTKYQPQNVYGYVEI
jgi:hypothetical protein